MKNSIFTSLLSAAFAVAAFPQAAFASPASAAHVPADWYQLPEDGGSKTYSFSANDSQLDQSLGRIFSAQHGALSDADSSALRIAPPADKPADWVPWRFVAMISDLSVSAAGLIGVLSFKGTPSVSVYWQKREKFGKHLVEEQSSPEFPTFNFTSGDSKKQFESQVDAIHRTALASGRVKKSKALRGEIAKAVGQFREMTAAIDGAAATVEWYPSRLRMDLEISANGQIKWGTVGGAVRIRLEWFHIQTAASGHKLAASQMSLAQSSLQDLVGSLAEDLASVSATAPAPQFRASGFMIGLGVGAAGKIGVAKASAQAMGYLYFDRVKSSSAPPRFASEKSGFRDASFYLVDRSANPAAESFAQANGIEIVRAERLADGGQSGVMYKVDREKFRGGLKKAFGIGNYFAQQAAASQGEDWAISTVKPGFAMSVSGTIGLVTMTGQLTAQIEFKNQNF